MKALEGLSDLGRDCMALSRVGSPLKSRLRALIAFEACKGPQTRAGALTGFKAPGASKALKGLQGALRAIESLKKHRGP